MFDFRERVGAIVEKVPSFPAVNPDDTQQKLTTQAKSHRRLALADDVLDIVLKIGLQYVLFCELALEIGSEPDARQRAGLGQERLGIKHVGSWRLERM